MTVTHSSCRIQQLEDEPAQVVSALKFASASTTLGPEEPSPLPPPSPVPAPSSELHGATSLKAKMKESVFKVADKVVGKGKSSGLGVGVKGRREKVDARLSQEIKTKKPGILNFFSVNRPGERERQLEQEAEELRETEEKRRIQAEKEQAEKQEKIRKQDRLRQQNRRERVKQQEIRDGLRDADGIKLKVTVTAAFLLQLEY